MKTTLQKIEKAYTNRTPFVSYKEPESTTVSSFFMKNDELIFTSDFQDSGFVFAPFDACEKAVFFSIEKASFTQEEIKITADYKFFENDCESIKGRKDHINLVEKTLEKIRNSSLQKVVISREEQFTLSNFDLLAIYQKLLLLYKNAFVYVWFHPKIGLWFGATPETLLHISDENFTTMSLAGTQLFKEDDLVEWGSKELDEQQLVTDFIVNQLQPITTSLDINKRETVRAGNLLHLKTKVTGKLSAKSSLKQLVRALHPTPAVCGLPKKEAFDFITKNENYNRSFYTGFLGELNLSLATKNKASKLYVNLRCMQIKNESALIYVGGGITKDSNAEKEWEETVSKSKTIKKVL